jgi:hypothetical protein
MLEQTTLEQTLLEQTTLEQKLLGWTSNQVFPAFACFLLFRLCCCSLLRTTLFISKTFYLFRSTGLIPRISQNFPECQTHCGRYRLRKRESYVCLDARNNLIVIEELGNTSQNKKCESFEETILPIFCIHTYFWARFNPSTLVTIADL